MILTSNDKMYYSQSARLLIAKGETRDRTSDCRCFSRRLILLGSIPSAYIIGKFKKGTDIRKNRQ